MTIEIGPREKGIRQQDRRDVRKLVIDDNHVC